MICSSTWRECASICVGGPTTRTASSIWKTMARRMSVRSTLRQVVQGLDTGRRDPEEAASGSPRGAGSASPTPTPLPLAPSPPPVPPPFTLPVLGKVTMSVASTNGSAIRPRVGQAGGPAALPAAGRPVVLPRSRGTAIRPPWRGAGLPGGTRSGVRDGPREARGPGDLDLARRPRCRPRSRAPSGEDGRARWSKSNRRSTEDDLRVAGSSRALRRERYEGRGRGRPTNRSRCFANPAALLAASRLILELGTLRACIEDLGC